MAQPAPYTFKDALGNVLQSGSSLTYQTTYNSAGSYAVTIAASNASTVSCGTALDVTSGPSCGALTDSITASPTRLPSGGGTTHVAWSASGVNGSCIITENGTTINTISAISCGIPSSSIDPTISEQTKYCIICDGNQAAKRCVNVNVGSQFHIF